MEELEQRLSGGNVTVAVVRVGSTVRRPAGPWTPSVDALLRHLTAAGFDGSPRSFGIDDQNRHVVEWIDGAVTHPYVRAASTDPSLRAVGRLIRAFHDAASDFSPPSDAVWNVVIEPDSVDSVVHHDLASWNFVHGGPRVAFIDWDNAGPGSTLWDLALSAISFSRLGTGPLDAACRDLRALVDGYGLDGDGRRRLVPLLAVRSQALVDLLEGGKASAMQPWATLWDAGHGEAWRQIARYAGEHHDEIVAALE